MTVLTTFVQIKENLERKRDEYENQLNEWHDDGLAPHYCEHGTNLWVDYDNICGPCEDGMHLSSPSFLRTYAIEQALEFHKSLRELGAAYCNLTKLISASQCEALAEIYVHEFDALARKYGVYQNG